MNEKKELNIPVNEDAEDALLAPGEVRRYKKEKTYIKHDYKPKMDNVNDLIPDNDVVEGAPSMPTEIKKDSTILKEKNNNTKPKINRTINEIEDLTNCFVGDKISKFKKHKFSLYFFFFDIFYLIYRKLYGFAIGWGIFAALMLSEFKNDADLIIIYAFVKIFVSLGFNSIYLDVAKDKALKIKLKNKNKTYEELRNIAKEKGGVNKYLYIYIIIFVVTYILSNAFINNL